MHGTWTLARALALAGLPRAQAFTLDATFRRPVELPSDIQVRAWCAADGQSDKVQVSSPDGSATFVKILLAVGAPARQNANPIDAA